MEKDLTIIIPTYNDTFEKITCTLNSIVQQSDYDLSRLEVVIVDDSSTNNLIDWDEVIKIYPQLNIKFIQLSENKGPGNARQVALDNSNGNFVFFLDCGDSLYNSTVLSIFNGKKLTNSDIISTKIFDEETGNKRRSFLFNNAYIFGFFIKRQFLLMNNIRFSEILRWEEDSFFEAKLRYYLPSVESAGIIGYSYNVDSNSITRINNHEYQNDFLGFSAMVVKSILLCDFYKKERNYKKMVDESMEILSICYSRFYSYLYKEQNISKRMSKILYLLRILIEQCGLNLITDNEEFITLFIKNVYRKNCTTQNDKVPYDKINDFMTVIGSYDNLYDDYNIDGTNITINELIGKISGKKNNNKNIK